MRIAKASDAVGTTVPFPSQLPEIRISHLGTQNSGKIPLTFLYIQLNVQFVVDIGMSH